MDRKVAPFRALPSFLCPPCPPAHHYNAGHPPPTPPLQHTDTYIKTHTHTPCPAPWGTQARVGAGVGFPDYLSRFQQMVEELSSWGHTALLPNSPSPSHKPECSSISLPFSFSPKWPQDQILFLLSGPPKNPSRTSSRAGPDPQLLNSVRTLEQIMPSDFLTPFLELDEEFCKVRAMHGKLWNS